jgi:hypothetical protein
MQGRGGCQVALHSPTMKNKLTIGILVFCLLILVAYLASSEHFLPMLRYRTIFRWLPRSAEYTPLLARNKDSTYWICVGASGKDERILVPWFGDTIRGFRSWDGWTNENKTEYIGTSDSAVVKIRDGRLIPMGPGTAEIVLRFPAEQDTATLGVKLEVREVSSHFVIMQPQTQSAQYQW